MWRKAIVISVVIASALGVWALGGYFVACDQCIVCVNGMTRLARQIDTYRREHGNYPLAADVDALRNELSSPQETNFPNDDRLRYASDGRSYRLIVPGSTFIHGCATLELVDGEWTDWPIFASDDRMRTINVELLQSRR
jgi:hypothetical protein